MKYSGRSILITGGATGIGFALAKRFVAADNRVVICGRRSEKLTAVQGADSRIITLQCDVSKEDERIRLFDLVSSQYPEIDVLVNNAGIQNRPPALINTQDWSAHRCELATNLEAPMHLSMLFISHLLQKPRASIINVSSGLAFSPISFMATYCASKAALHSFTLSLRHQLQDTPIEVVEIIPPKVNTDLGGVGLHDDGAPLDEFADHAWRELCEGSLEFGYGFSERNRLASRETLDQVFKTLNPSRASGS
jgi:uncharacterized oxidoreductase